MQSHLLSNCWLDSPVQALDQLACRLFRCQRHHWSLLGLLTQILVLQLWLNLHPLNWTTLIHQWVGGQVIVDMVGYIRKPRHSNKLLWHSGKLLRTPLPWLPLHRLWCHQRQIQVLVWRSISVLRKSGSSRSYPFLQFDQWYLNRYHAISQEPSIVFGSWEGCIVIFGLLIWSENFYMNCPFFDLINTNQN